MAKLNIDFSHFKKVSSDKDHTVLRHDDGHEFRLAHGALSKENIRQLSKLKMADGGQVPKSSDDPYAQAGKKLAQDPENPGVKSLKNAFGDTQAEAPKKPKSYADGGEVALPPVPTALQPDQAGSIPLQQEPSQAPPLPVASSPQGLSQPSSQSAMPPSAPPQQSAPMVPPSPAVPAPDVMEGYQKQIQGTQQEAEAQAKLGQEEATKLHAQASATQNLMDSYQDHLKQLDDERQAFQQDIKDTKVDPYRYWGSMNAGGQIATMIGLVMGGLGGGLTGQGNDALKLLNANIDRDIDAQKADLGKKETLLNANMRQFGNLRDATDMTKIMQLDMINNQLKEAAARAQSPLAKANALKTTGALEQQIAPLQQQLATRRMLQSTNASGQNLSGIDPSVFIPSVVPEHEQAAAFKEVQEAQNMSQAKDNITKAFNKLADLNTVGNRVTSPIQTARQVAAIKDPLVAGLSKETAGRFTEQDAGMLDSLFPRPGDSEGTVAQKRLQMDRLVSEKMHFPVLEAYGLGPSKFASTSSNSEARLNPQQKSYADWAKANPNDPRSAMVLKKLGLQ